MQRAYDRFPLHPQLLEAYEGARARYESLDCVNLIVSAENATRVATRYNADLLTARKASSAVYPALVTALAKQDPPFLSGPEIAAISETTYFDSNSVEFRGYILSCLSAIYRSLHPKPVDLLFPVWDSTLLPCIEKQSGLSCFMHATHSLMCRQLGGLRAEALYVLVSHSVSTQLVKRASSSSTTSGASSAASAPPADTYYWAPLVSRPDYRRLFAEVTLVKHCTESGFGARQLSSFFALLNRPDLPSVFFGCHDLREIEARSSTFNSKSPRTFCGVVELVSRYVDRMSRYGTSRIVHVIDEDDSGVDSDCEATTSESVDAEYVERDARNLREPVVPIIQFLFCYGAESRSGFNIGHFVSAQRVDVNDTRIKFPKNTHNEHKSRFWWLQDSMTGLKLFHESSMPNYFFGPKQTVYVVPLRLPLSSVERMTTVAAQFDSAINALLDVAGLASFGPIALAQ